MKDVERLILKSFAYAVMQQKDLPNAIRQHIQAVANSFDTRVAELDAIARSSPLLEPNYSWAYDILSGSAAERGLGADFPPADYDEDGPAYEPSNIVSAPERYQLEEAKKMLNTLDSKLNKASSTDAQQALLSKNLIQSLRDRFAS